MIHSEAFLINYLLNSLWQVPLLFAAAKFATFLLRRHSSLAVHRVWVTTAVLETMLPAISAAAPTLLLLLSRLLPDRNAGGSSSVTVTFGVPAILSRLPLSSVLVHLVLCTYGLGLLYAGAKLFWGLHRTASLRAQLCLPTLTPPAGEVWQRCLDHFRVPTAVLCESALVRTPLTLGLRPPLVLLPPGFLDRLSEGDLCTLFAHECAHIQRRDFRWNVVYEMFSVPIAFHPVARSTRSHLVETREWVCDELAANMTSPLIVYAQSLLRLATLLAQPAPSAAPHAIGMLDANALERRVMQLTNSHLKTTFLRRAAALSASALIALATCASSWALRTNVSTSGYQVAETDSPSTKVPAGVMAGNVQTRVPPTYPKEAKEARIQGSVVLRAIISKDGSVENLTVVSGPNELMRSAIEAVRQWTYKPYEVDGDPIAVETTIAINYQLAD